MRHPKYIFIITLVFSVGLLISTPSQAQFGNLKKGLKNKLKRKKKKKTNSRTSNRTTRRSSSRSSRGTATRMPKGMTAELAKEYKAFYKAKYELSANSWYHPTNASSKFMAEKLPTLKKLNYPALRKRMDEDRKKFPKMFEKNGYGSTASSAPSADLYWANNYAAKIVAWEKQLAKEEKYMPGAVQHWITQCENTKGPNKIQYAQDAIALADALLTIKPQNEMLKEYKQEAQKVLDKSLTNFIENLVKVLLI